MTAPPTTKLQLDPVWTKKHDTNGLFFAKTGALPAGSFSAARSTIEIRDMSGNLRLEAALQTSNDLATWGSTQVFGTVRSSEGVHVEDGYDDLSAYLSDKLYVRLGHYVRNGSGESTLENALSGGRFEYK